MSNRKPSLNNCADANKVDKTLSHHLYRNPNMSNDIITFLFEHGADINRMQRVINL